MYAENKVIVHPSRKRERKEDPVKDNLIQANDNEIIAVVVSYVKMVANIKESMLDLRATTHICAGKNVFSSNTTVGDGEEIAYGRLKNGSSS